MAVPPIAVDQDVVRRLAFLRGLFIVADNQSKRGYPMAAAAVLTLQDAVEGMLVLIAEQSGARIPKNPNFDQYWEPVVDALKEPDLLHHRTAMGRLNKARVNLKHHGILPDGSELSGFRLAAYNFLADASVLAFDTDFASETLIELLPEGEVADLLRAAEAATQAGDHRTALENAARAFNTLNRQTRPNDWHGRPVAAYRPSPFASAFHLKLEQTAGRKFAKEWDSLLEGVAQISEVTDLANRGIEHSDYLRFKSVTPSVMVMAGGNTRVVWSGNKTPDAAAAQFCINFVLDTAVRLLGTSHGNEAEIVKNEEPARE